MRVLKLLYVTLPLMICSENLCSAQTQIGGIKLNNTMTYGAIKMPLNGAGIREKYWLNMYVGSLYVKTKTTDPSAIINANEAMAIQINIISSMITPSRMEESITEGFEKSTKGKTEAIKTRIEELKSVFREGIKVGDVFVLLYDPTQGTRVYKNGKVMRVIQGLDFKKALFGIWLSDDPVQDDLKEAMLGRN